jgi:YggT family protein
MMSLLGLILNVIDLVFWIVIISAVMSWLVAFGVVNLRHPVMAQIYDVLTRVTEPLYRPFRRFIPSFGGLDVSPVILLLLLTFLRNLIVEYGFSFR